jgi:hypothetical protein
MQLPHRSFQPIAVGLEGDYVVGILGNGIGVIPYVASRAPLFLHAGTVQQRLTRAQIILGLKVPILFAICLWQGLPKPGGAALHVSGRRFHSERAVGEGLRVALIRNVSSSGREAVRRHAFRTAGPVCVGNELPDIVVWP